MEETMNAATETVDVGPGQDPGLAVSCLTPAEGEWDWTTVGYLAGDENDFTDEELSGLARWGCFVPQVWP